MTDAPLEVLVIPPAKVVDPPPAKRGRGRPKGAKNKPKKKTSAAFDAARAVARVGTQFKPGAPANSVIQKSHADARSRKVKWREEKTEAKHSYLNTERFLALLQNHYGIAMDETQLASDRLRAGEFLIEIVAGKASSKVEIETEDVNRTLDQRREAFDALAGFVAAQRHRAMQETADIIDALPPGNSDGSRADRVALPPPPATVDLRHDEVSGLPQAGEVRLDVLPQLVVDQEAARGVPRPETGADQRDIRLEEPEDGAGVHGLPAEVGGGPAGTVAVVDGTRPLDVDD
jgi:hypothetical protein